MNRSVSRTLSACLFAASLAACGDSGEGADPGKTTTKSVPAVEVWQAAPGPLETRRTWPATIEPLRVLEVVAPENGRLIETMIKTGDRVDAGQPIMTLRFPESEAARVSLASRAEVLQQEVSRLQTLAGSRAVSDAETAAIRIEKLETLSRLHAIEALLGEGRILAPVAGTVLETLVSPGAPVVEGTVLARIDDAGSPGIRIDVPNSELRYFDNLESLAVLTDAPHTIERVVRHGGERPNMTRLELWLAPAAGITYPVAATLAYRSSREALMIPWSAVAADDDRAWVGQVNRESGEVRHQKVVLGETSGTRVEVVEGLASGDWVLRFNPRSFAEGAVVAPEPANESEPR